MVMKNLDPLEKCLLLSALETIDVENIINRLRDYGWQEIPREDIYMSIAVLRNMARRYPVKSLGKLG